MRCCIPKPGKPNQNAHLERYNRIVRHEWPDLHVFESAEKAYLLTTQWFWEYNTELSTIAGADGPRGWLLDKAAQSRPKRLISQPNAFIIGRDFCGYYESTG